MIQALKDWLELKLWKAERNKHRAIRGYDLTLARAIELDIDMLTLLRDSQPDYSILVVWLKVEIVLTHHKETKYRNQRKYMLASQQADFRAALQRVQSKVDLIERQNESL